MKGQFRLALERGYYTWVREFRVRLDHIMDKHDFDCQAGDCPANRNSTCMYGRRISHPAFTAGLLILQCRVRARRVLGLRASLPDLVREYNLMQNFTTFHNLQHAKIKCKISIHSMFIYKGNIYLMHIMKGQEQHEKNLSLFKSCTINYIISSLKIHYLLMCDLSCLDKSK